MNQSIDVLAGLVTDYATQLHNSGQKTTAQIVTHQANAALAQIRSGVSDQKVPAKDNGNDPNI